MLESKRSPMDRTFQPPTPATVIVDFGLGNLFSVQKACAAVGLSTGITSCRRAIAAAQGIILPGVGAFGDAMRNLERLDLVGPLREAAAREKPIIGICLGMQLLLSESEEFGLHRGLSLISGRVRKFDCPRSAHGKFKVPQVGWNTVHIPDGDGAAWIDSPLHTTDDGEAFYFVHSYYAEPADARDVLAVTRYGDFEFCSSVRRENVVGFQFHPERSGPAGLRIYAAIAEFIRRNGASASSIEKGLYAA